jgi:signal peptide peptidase SppA
MGIESLFQDQAWAIHPAKLDEINAFVQARAEGRLTEAASPGKSGARAEATYQNQSGVAVIPVSGILAKKANLITQYSGGTSYQLLQRDILAALYDKEVKAILLDIDSPGGTVDGAFEASDFIHSARGKKPIVAYANGLAASAAYLLGSAADSVHGYVSAQVGSIGVCLTHYDLSKRDEMRGVTRTEIYAGKYKRMGTDSKPLDDEAKAYLQDRVDHLYGLFLQGIARNRGVSMERALAMADGKVFIGSQARSAGLLDGMATFDSVLTSLMLGEPVKNTNSSIQKGITMSHQTTDGPRNFEAAVQMFLDRGCKKRSEALAKAAREYPELHEEYILRANSDHQARRAAERERR